MSRVPSDAPGLRSPPSQGENLTAATVSGAARASPHAARRAPRVHARRYFELTSGIEPAASRYEGVALARWISQCMAVGEGIEPSERRLTAAAMYLHISPTKFTSELGGNRTLAARSKNPACRQQTPQAPDKNHDG